MRSVNACRGPNWLGMEFNQKLRKWIKEHMGGNDHFITIMAAGGDADLQMSPTVKKSQRK